MGTGRRHEIRASLRVSSGLIREAGLQREKADSKARWTKRGEPQAAGWLAWGEEQKWRAVPAARTARSQWIIPSPKGSVPGLLSGNEGPFVQKTPVPPSLLPIFIRNSFDAPPGSPSLIHRSDLPLPFLLPQEMAWGVGGYGETQAPLQGMLQEMVFSPVPPSPTLGSWPLADRGRRSGLISPGSGSTVQTELRY